MRRSTSTRWNAAAILVLCVCAQAAWSQGQDKMIRSVSAGRGGPDCDVAAPRCDRCANGQPCDKCQPPSQPRQGPREEYEAREVGAYIAPPRTGAFRGPVARRGFEGGAIIFPEIKLRLPSIEWPAHFHGHSGARMIIEESVAPWESQGYVAGPVGAPAAERRGDEAPQKRSVEDCERQLEECRRQLEELRQQYDRLKHLESSLDKQPGPQQAPRSGPFQAPPGKRPGPPGFPPAPEPEQGANQAPGLFPERPAAYAQPIGSAEQRRSFITEPKRPAARITSLRPAEP